MSEQTTGQLMVAEMAAKGYDRREQYGALKDIMPDEMAGATDLECEADIRKIKGYCTHTVVARCSECSLCNYGRDCHNCKVA